LGTEPRLIKNVLKRINILKRKNVLKHIIVLKKIENFFFKFDMEAFLPRKKGCLLDCLNWVPNRGACIDACLSCDVQKMGYLR